jgi:hypothetical protein
MMPGGPGIRNEKPLFVIDFWNERPLCRGLYAGGRRIFISIAKGRRTVYICPPGNRQLSSK